MVKTRDSKMRGLPTKEEILAFIAAQPGKVGTREIARAFHLKNTDRVALKHMLRDMADSGAVEGRHKKLHPPGRLPVIVVADIASRDRDGEFIARPTEWDTQRHGEAPAIRVHIPKRTKPIEAAGVGDRVVLRTERIDGEDEGDNAIRYRGRVIKIVDRAKLRVLGIFRALPSGGGRLMPVDKKNLGKELTIPAEHTGGATDGDLVAVEVVHQGRFGLPLGHVKETLGSIASEGAVSLIAIHAHGIPNVFPRECLAEADGAQPATLGHGAERREDWRDVPLVTIDPPDAKDHDDAVHAAPDTDPNNPGGFILNVAIADVAHYVLPHSALDREALNRGNSVYFPDRVVPMLPERISNELCSLKPHEDRAALAVRMVIDAKGHKKSHSFHRVLIRSAAKLHYAQAQAAFDGETDNITRDLIEPIIKPLWAAYHALTNARAERSPLDLELPERKLVLTAKGTVDRVVVAERRDANKLIEEFMILANVAAAETLERAKLPLIYRVHDEPTPEKMLALHEFLKTLDISMPKSGALRPQMFNHVLALAKGRDDEQLVNEVVLRSQAQAEFAAENYGHFGLNLRRYAHFTSPIRRYADLIVHRGLIRALGLHDGALEDTQDVKSLGEIAAQISAAERRAMSAERETVDRLIAHHLADRIGAQFEGRISGVTRSGLFVKLDETGADGFVPARTIGNEYYRFDESARAFIGNGSGETFRLGDHVQVELVEAAPVAGALRFKLLSEGTRGGRRFSKSGKKDAPPGNQMRGKTKRPSYAALRNGKKR